VQPERARLTEQDDLIPIFAAVLTTSKLNSQLT
jgi:hypothetical protein